VTVAPAAFGSTGQFAYAAAFAVAAVACFAAVRRARRIDDADTRRGLVALVLTSGAWATFHVGFLLAPTPAVGLAFYYAGLVVGISAVVPWLYFCSAYTGRSLHRAGAVRKATLVVLGFVLAVKLTNPVHGLYFRWEWAAEPFPHLVVENLLLHWTALGLSYALATVGYFMLAELFWQVDHDTKPLFALVGITGLPIVLDIVGAASPALLDITYEPLGVAAFAVGIVFVYLEDFRSVQLTGDRDDPVVVLDDDDRVREFNAPAGELFPALASDRPVGEALPGIAGSVDEDDGVVAVDRAGGRRYYQLSRNAFSNDAVGLGRMLTLTDITEREAYRTELERQNERLEQFAGMVSHDLRNPLNVAQGRLEEAIARHEDDEALAETANSLDRMASLIEDLLTLARQGQPISDTEPVGLSAVAEDAWSVVESDAATLAVEADLTVEADADRLQQLLENLFRNAIEHGRPDAALTVGRLEDGGGFYVEDDGPGIPEAEREEVFESGYTTNEDGTGFGLAIVREIVDAHGWSVRVTDADGGGARFEFAGVREAEQGADDGSFAAAEDGRPADGAPAEGGPFDGA